MDFLNQAGLNAVRIVDNQAPAPSPSFINPKSHDISHKVQSSTENWWGAVLSVFNFLFPAAHFFAAVSAGRNQLNVLHSGFLFFFLVKPSQHILDKRFLHLEFSTHEFINSLPARGVFFI